MTMHIEGPWLSTTGKKKGKQKFRNAEQARKSRELKEDWNKLVAKYETKTEIKKPVKSLKLNLSYRGQDTNIPSAEFTGGVCAKAPDKVYTGTAMKGIGVMHKSNAVPIFSDEEAVNIASMRR